VCCPCFQVLIDILYHPVSSKFILMGVKMGVKWQKMLEAKNRKVVFARVSRSDMLGRDYPW